MENKDLVVKFRSDFLFELTQDMDFYFGDFTKDLQELQDFDKLKEYTGTYDTDKTYIRIPKGFATDFGSIPQVFQSILSPIGTASKAFVVHDFLIVLFYKGIISRKTADKIFLLCMKRIGVNKFKSSILYGFVRFYSTCIYPIQKFFGVKTNNLEK